MKKFNPLVAIAALVSFLTVLVAYVSAQTPEPAKGGGPPVLVELFTSEGCSSCPQADLLLKKLDTQAIPGADVIVLSEHVDYWNHDGWKDVYSNSSFTERQTDYERRLKVNQAYTPQMVVDGATQLNGSNGSAVAHAIVDARGHAKVPVKISSVAEVNSRALRLHVEAAELPADLKAKKAEIFVAVALDHAESHVSAGENKGHDLSHVAVVESITKIGTVERGKNFDREVQVKLNSNLDPANLRLIVFVQESDRGEVFGASQLNAPVKMSLLGHDSTDPSANAGSSNKSGK